MSNLATSDLIAMIVDRDTPPDLDGDTVVDWDMIGNPITRRMVDKFSRASQATPEAKKENE